MLKRTGSNMYARIYGWLTGPGCSVVVGALIAPLVSTPAAAQNWEQLGPVGTLSGLLVNADGVYDANADRMVMLGGDISSEQFNGTLMLNVLDDPPEISCELVAIDVEEDEGLFMVVFTVTDDTDPDPLVEAFIVCDGLEVPVTDGELVSLELDDEVCEVEESDGVLEMKGAILALVVIAEDEAGNFAVCSALPLFAADEDDDDDDDGGGGDDDDDGDDGDDGDEEDDGDDGNDGGDGSD